MKAYTMKLEWTLYKEYPNYNMWSHKTPYGIRYECFPKNEDPNEMIMTKSGYLVHKNSKTQLIIY